MTVLMIDGGTTNTRFTLVQDGKVLMRTERVAGAREADASHRNERLRACVTQEIRTLQQMYTVDAVCIAGMITSENGLAEIPHVSAPADVEALARSVRVLFLPDVTELPILCVPGIRTQDTPLTQRDIMRGEETEIMGDLYAHPTSGSRLYLHFGSHNKAVLVVNGAIVSSVTTISGELLSAVLENTILKSSAGTLDGFVLDPEAAAEGFRLAQANGLSRALFQTRLSAVFDGASQRQALSMITGMLCCEDALAFGALLDAADEVVMYGRDTFVDGYRACLSARLKDCRLRVISYEESQWLCMKGMKSILKRRETL